MPENSVELVYTSCLYVAYYWNDIFVMDKKRRVNIILLI